METIQYRRRNRTWISALLVVAAGAAGYWLWAARGPGAQRASQGNTPVESQPIPSNVVVMAVQAEGARAGERFVTSEHVKWELDYDAAKGKNYIEIWAGSPLEHHPIHFRVRFEGWTREEARAGRRYLPALFSTVFEVRDLSPRQIQRGYVYLPAPVIGRADKWWGRLADWFRSRQTLTWEPALDSGRMTVKVCAEEMATL